MAIPAATRFSFAGRKSLDISFSSGRFAFRIMALNSVFIVRHLIFSPSFHARGSGGPVRSSFSILYALWRCAAIFSTSAGNFLFVFNEHQPAPVSANWRNQRLLPPCARATTLRKLAPYARVHGSCMAARVVRSIPSMRTFACSSCCCVGGRAYLDSRL